MTLRLIICIIAFVGLNCSCKAQLDNDMIEKYDFSLSEKIKESGDNHIVVESGDKVIFVNQIYESGTFCNEYSIDPDFYMTQKLFYANGILKTKGKYVGEYVPVGTWYYYDEKGNLEKIINEDEKFGKITPDSILSFLDKEGHINLQSGFGREKISFTEIGESFIEKGSFFLKFLKKKEHKLSEKYSLWVITIKENESNNFYQIRYFIHGDTGEVLEKQVKQVLYTE